MAEYMFEILRTRTVEIDERIEVGVQIPDSVPEDEREDWVLNKLENDELSFPDGDWEASSEDSSSNYQEVTEL
jgi:hypothetical protein